MSNNLFALYGFNLPDLKNNSEKTIDKVVEIKDNLTMNEIEQAMQNLPEVTESHEEYEQEGRNFQYDTSGFDSDTITVEQVDEQIHNLVKDKEWVEGTLHDARRQVELLEGLLQEFEDAMDELENLKTAIENSEVEIELTITVRSEEEAIEAVKEAYRRATGG